jgi:dihydrofolate synthase/folylpolyglutamate synthase
LAIDSLLQQFERFGVHLGLESIQRLLADLGNPHERVPVIHVAGSNGKGSVCAYLSAVLTEAGYRVGRYTSPHLVDWNERICLNEQPIPSDDLENVLQQVIAAIQPDEPSPTQFEVITAAAWLYFAQQQVDIAVIEVGLGGRLDATNVCDRPLVSIITSLSREHWQRLGPTLANIAYEKAGILKPGCPAVIGQLPSEAKTVVDQRIAELGCTAVYPEPAVLVKGKGGEEGGQGSRGAEGQRGKEVEYQGIRYSLPLLGAVQLKNSALAISALQILRQQGWQISEEAIANGMAKTRWAGRLQWFTWNGQRILIDGAHNPASAEVLRQFVDDIGYRVPGTESKPESLTPNNQPLTPASLTPITWVIGMLSTKDHADVFKALLREGDRLYLVPVPDHSSADPENLAQLAKTICPTLTSCQTCSDVMAALKAATSEPGRDSPLPPPLTVLCGSLYLIGHFFQLTRLTS